MIDGRNLLPPEPLELTLAALDQLTEGDDLLLLLNCRPAPLFGILRRHGYFWHERAQDDGSFEITIRKSTVGEP